MPIMYEATVARLSGHVGVEEAEALLSWLQATPEAMVDLSDCSHLHASSLQVLMAARRPIRHWPGETELGEWLRSAVQETFGDQEYEQDHHDR